MFLSARHGGRIIGIAAVVLALLVIAARQNNAQPLVTEAEAIQTASVYTDQLVIYGFPVKGLQEKLATVWANALKERDGKTRYQIMSENAKQKFEHEQAMQDGSINFVIGVSSPWVEHFEIEHKDWTAVITYFTKTSEAAYSSKEMISFVKENGKLLVDDYKYIYEDKLRCTFPETH